MNSLIRLEKIRRNRPASGLGPTCTWRRSQRLYAQRSTPMIGLARKSRRFAATWSGAGGQSGPPGNSPRKADSPKARSGCPVGAAEGPDPTARDEQRRTEIRTAPERRDYSHLTSPVPQPRYSVVPALRTECCRAASGRGANLLRSIEDNQE